MLISFTLSMPRVNTWCGHWSGEGRPYTRVYSFRGKKAEEKARLILKRGSFCHDFGDGWTARLSVSAVSTQDARLLRQRSQGFCGYDWMIASIIQHLEIRSQCRSPRE